MVQSKKKKLVVIGGGFAGSLIARKIENKMDVILIDSKDYFEFTPGILRTLVEPRHIKKIQVKHKDYLENAEVIIGEVKEVSDKFVLINGKKIYFDYLAICSGSNYSVPFKEKSIIIANRGEHIIKNYKSLIKAKDVLIIGGGLVGVELAGEILYHYKDKKITIVHSSFRLIQRNRSKSIRYIEKNLIKSGVNIIYNERVIAKEGKYFITEGKRKIKSDIAFLCTGITPQYDFMNKSFKKYLDENNQIRVNEFLQVGNINNIFCAGDVNSISIEKTAQNAEIQAETVVKNILNIENKKSLVKYAPKKTPMIISLGKKKGVFEFGGFVITGLIPALLKDFVEWKEMRKFKI